LGAPVGPPSHAVLAHQLQGLLPSVGRHRRDVLIRHSAHVQGGLHLPCRGAGTIPARQKGLDSSPSRRPRGNRTTRRAGDVLSGHRGVWSRSVAVRPTTSPTSSDPGPGREGGQS
jgi:hypothetical protein